MFMVSKMVEMVILLYWDLKVLDEEEVGQVLGVVSEPINEVAATKIFTAVEHRLQMHCYLWPMAFQMFNSMINLKEKLDYIIDVHTQIKMDEEEVEDVIQEVVDDR